MELAEGTVRYFVAWVFHYLSCEKSNGQALHLDGRLSIHRPAAPDECNRSLFHSRLHSLGFLLSWPLAGPLSSQLPFSEVLTVFVSSCIYRCSCCDPVIHWRHTHATGRWLWTAAAAVMNMTKSLVHTITVVLSLFKKNNNNSQLTVNESQTLRIVW